MYSVCRENHLDWITWDDDDTGFANLPTGTASTANSMNPIGSASMAGSAGTAGMAGTGTMRSHMRDFLTFLELASRPAAPRAPPDTPTDAIRATARQLVVIDLLPSTLLPSSAAPRAREDRWPSSSRLTRSAAFARLLLRLNAAPRTERSRLFVWVVDTTNEVRGDNAVRYLLPAAALHAITLNAPSVRLSWSSSLPSSLAAPPRSRRSSAGLLPPPCAPPSTPRTGTSGRCA